MLHPVAGHLALAHAGGEIFEVGHEITALIDEHVGIVGRDLPRLFQGRAEHLRRIAHRRPRGGDVGLGDRHRHEVGLGEVAVVARLLLLPLGPGDAGRIVPAAGLLGHLPHLDLRGLPLPPLPRGLVDQRPLHRSKGVHVFDFDDRRLGDAVVGPCPALQRNVEVHVGVDPETPLLHVAVADTEIHQQEFEFIEPGPGLLGRPQIGLRHDLAERRAGAVEIDPRVGGARRLVVHALAGVFLEVYPDDAHLAGERPLRIDHF